MIKKTFQILLGLAIILEAIPAMANAQTALAWPNNLFSLPTSGAKAGTVITLSVNKTFQTNITHLITSPSTTYGLAVNAIIHLPKSDSLARLVLIDKNNNEYLLYEGYANLTGQGDFTLSNFCDETCSLSSITPAKIRVEINNASVDLKTLTLSIASGAKIANLKSQQDAYKISQLNQKITASGGKWIAGATSVSGLTYSQKKKLFSNPDGTPVKDLPNLQGFEYYKGGIFEIKSANSSAKSSSADSNIIVPDSYDWRNINGENWITPVKNQVGNTCPFYGMAGTYESIINLFYNQRLNIDLSEQMMIDCGSVNYNVSPPVGVISPIAELSTFTECSYLCSSKKWGGLADEACDSPQTRVPDPNNKNCNTTNICGDWKSRLWGILDYYYYRLDPKLVNATFPGGESTQDINKFKSWLIKNGPIWSGYNPWGHAMTLVGYGIIKQGDNVVSGSTIWDPIIIPAGSPLIGQTYWTFKNSWDTRWGENGYGKFVIDFGVDNLDGTVIRGLITPPTNHSYPYWPKINGILWDGKTACVDKDADNYCNWGIPDQPPTGTVCPTNCKKTAGKFIKDCDDSNNKLGSFISENNLNCSSVLYHSADTNTDWKIELTELTRIIQFFNSNGYHVQTGTEDGFAPIPEPTSKATTTLDSFTVGSGSFTPPTDHSYWPAGFDGKVKCIDKDNDSYCYWGISDQPPAGTVCPMTCKKNAGKFIKDCDDSNNKLGPFISENNLNCAPVPATPSTAKCVDYDTSPNIVKNSTPLPSVKGYTYDTFSDPKFDPSAPNPKIEANADSCSLSNGIKVSKCSGVGCGLVEMYCANNRRMSRYYLYGGNPLGGYDLRSVCPNGCSDGACAISTTTSTTTSTTSPTAVLRGNLLANILKALNGILSRVGS